MLSSKSEQGHTPSTGGRVRGRERPRSADGQGEPWVSEPESVTVYFVEWSSAWLGVKVAVLVAAVVADDTRDALFRSGPDTENTMDAGVDRLGEARR